MMSRTYSFLILAVALYSCGTPKMSMRPVSENGAVYHVIDVNDSVSVVVHLMRDSMEKPLYYYSHIYSPVCEEDICYPVIIDLKWDLLGNFMDYETPVDSPLTKFDHTLFTVQDHDRLRGILSDKVSILRNVDIGDLIDKGTKIRSSVLVDGVTGATRPSVKDAVVGGAVYSTYILWHLTNGAIADSIRSFTEKELSDSLLMYFLRSDNYHYHYYALEHIPEDKLGYCIPEVIRLIGEGKDYVPFFAVDRLPAMAWTSGVYQIPLLSLLDSVDFKIQNTIINSFLTVPLEESGLEMLIKQIRALNEDQTIRVLSIAKRNAGKLGAGAISGISALTLNRSRQVSHLATGILQLLADENK